METRRFSPSAASCSGVGFSTISTSAPDSSAVRLAKAVIRSAGMFEFATSPAGVKPIVAEPSDAASAASASVGYRLSPLITNTWSAPANHSADATASAVPFGPSCTA